MFCAASAGVSTNGDKVLQVSSRKSAQWRHRGQRGWWVRTMRAQRPAEGSVGVTSSSSITAAQVVITRWFDGWTENNNNNNNESPAAWVTSVPSREQHPAVDSWIFTSCEGGSALCTDDERMLNTWKWCEIYSSGWRSAACGYGEELVHKNTHIFNDLTSDLPVWIKPEL